jgi:ferredoxin
MLAAGGILLLTGVFIARPYCRFLCPYGVILNLISRVSGKHLTITPANCIKCRLCENSCPFDAIQKPEVKKLPSAVSSQQSVDNSQISIHKIHSVYLILVLLLFTIAGGWVGGMFHENLAELNPKVRLAHALLNRANSQVAALSPELQAYSSSGKSDVKLYSEAASIIRKFHIGGWILGGFIGLVFGIKLANLSGIKKVTEYTPDKGSCLSCGRCMEYCPVKK